MNVNKVNDIVTLTLICILKRSFRLMLSPGHIVFQKFLLLSQRSLLYYAFDTRFYAFHKFIILVWIIKIGVVQKKCFASLFTNCILNFLFNFYISK